MADSDPGGGGGGGGGVMAMEVLIVCVCVTGCRWSGWVMDDFSRQVVLADSAKRL